MFVRAPLSWLREMVDWSSDADALGEALTRRGLAVEAIERPEAVRGVRAARLLEARPHPRADRLHICTVAAGGPVQEVVCGAPDLPVGGLVAWAAPGAVLPGGIAIGVREIRGVPSAGMLCAPDELGIPGGHAHLLDPASLLPPGAAPPPEGADLAAALGLDDPVLVLELTPNYAAHCQSILGVAREVAALTGGPLRRPGPLEPTEDRRHPVGAAVEVEAPDLCPRYVARVIRGLRAQASPAFLARRLLQCGLRPLGLTVDVTNFVMLELGQPLHAFDLARLRGDGVVARRAVAGESILTLDGEARELSAGDLVIADADGPVAVAGVMGGRRTEVTDATDAILLESATFAAEAVARTARRLGLPSEAAGRFGRGTDPGIARAAADRAAALLQALGGASVDAGTVERGPGVAPHTVSLRGRAARSLLGVRLSTSACGHLLQDFGFGVAADGPDRLRVAVPSWRPDVAAEVDLIEEIGRAYGYDRLPAVLPPGDPGFAAPDPVRALGERARDICLAAGCSEVMPWSFHGGALWDALRLPPEHPWRRAAAVANPMHGEQAWLRTALAGGLLRTLQANARHRRASAAIFEVGRVFRPRRPGGRPAEPLRLGLAGYGALRPADFSHPAEPCDFYALKGLCEAVLAVALPRAEPGFLRPAAEDLPFLHPGRAAVISTPEGGALLGYVGELHPAVALELDLPAGAVVAELDLDRVAGAAPEGRPGFRPLPRHPAVRRDVAVEVPEALPAAEVAARIRAAAGELLGELTLFDVFAGGAMAPGRRSLAFSLTYQAERTLTDAEVEARQTEVRRALSALPGAELR